jgi:hypothetical protein
MHHRKIRLQKLLVQRLRDIRDSHWTPRPIPELIRAALRQCVVGSEILQITTTRDNSEIIDIWLEDEHAGIPSRDIAARVAHAVIGVRTIPDAIKANR